MAMYYTPIPHEFLEEMGELSDAEYGRLIRWCQTYSITGEEMELSGNERFYRIRCKNNIDKIKAEYEENAYSRSGRARNAANARWKTQTDAQACPSMPEDAQACSSMPEDATDANKNKNININKNIKEKNDDSKESSSKKKAVITAWNEAVAGSIVPKLRVLSEDSVRYRMLNARIKQYGLEQVLEAVKNVRSSDFLRTSPWFSFDWFIKPNNFVKVLEGNYRDDSTRASPENTGGGSSWMDIAQELEKRT